MALSFIIDSVISYYLPFNFDKSGITIIPYISLMMFTLLNNTIGNEHRYIFATVSGLYYAIVYANSLLIYVLLYCMYAFLGKKYTKLAGIERNITPHMFRHSFATYLIEEGVDVSCVQQILGHSSIKTTQIYIHIAAKKQAEILREMHPRKYMNILRVA